MLDELLKKLKNTLPASLKEKFFKSQDDDEEEYDEDDENEEDEIEIVDDKTLTKKTKKLKIEDDEEEDEDEEDEDDDEEKKKKKKQQIIRAVIILVIAYVVVDEFFLSSNEEVVEEQIQERSVRPQGVTPPPPQEVQEEISSTPPQTETYTDISLNTETPPAPQEREPEIVPEPDPETARSEPVVAPAPSVPKVGLQEEGPREEAQFEQIEERPTSASPSQSLLDTISQRIVEKLEYTPPPDYIHAGRGLVYNCKGRHWACVERTSYFQCRDNMLWSEQEGKVAECYAKDVYESVDDCRTIQIHYINTNESTEFCQE